MTSNNESSFEIPPRCAALVCTDQIPWQDQLAALEGRLRQVIRARTGESGCVEDIYQQLALVVCQRIEQLRDASRFAPWSHRIAVVLSARHIRSKVRERKRLESLSVDSLSTINDKEKSYEPFALLIVRERHQVIREAMTRLAPRDREMLVLKYEDRLSYRELSEYLGITEKAVDRRLARARTQLRNELAQLGIHRS
ncbi:MAG: sigma-70 family RNA polymerase sigma factor [Pirellulales bacterium]